jgi:hypothetical protein
MTRGKKSVSSNGFKIRELEVTPALAERFLLHNHSNRNLSRMHVSLLARAMTAGDWRRTGDPIRFSEDGYLLDGQHRLQAIILSGRPQKLTVIDGVSPDTQVVIDVGRKRSLTDHLHMKGEKYASTLAATLRMVWAFENGQPSGKGVTPSHIELLELLANRPAIRESVYEGERVARALQGSRALYAAAHWILVGVDHDDADFFFDRLVDGANLVPGDAIFVLRHILEKDAFAARKLHTSHRLALIIKAWNAYRQGAQVKALSWKRGGARPEAFPVPV